MRPVSIEVMSQAGTCNRGHRPGDRWVIGEDRKTPAGVCVYAYNALSPFISAMMFEGKFPWKLGDDRITIACPDPGNPVVFEVKRLDPAPPTA